MAKKKASTAEYKTADSEAAPEDGHLTLKEALEMYEQYKSYWAENYKEALIDLKMVAGDRAVQWGAGWDADRLSERGKKVSLVINELPQFVHQVENDIRQNTPAVKVIPEGDGDVETADAFAGVIRGINYKSAADEATDTAASNAVRGGIGFILIDHDYVDDESDEQELLIKRIPDALTCYIDPASIEPDGRDANGAIMLEPLTKKEFQKLYPKGTFLSFTDAKNAQLKTDEKDYITLAQIFVRRLTGKHGKTIVIDRYRFSGAEMLSCTTFPGDYIPLVPVYGEESWIDGKRVIQSLVRQARDPQRRVNYWATKEAELLQMAPIAPVMAARGTLVNDRGQWQKPGDEMVLEYELKDIDGAPAPPPQRLQPPMPGSGIIAGVETAKQDIKEVLGMYAPSIAEPSNEKSGIAIQTRIHEGDTATYHFPDNVRRSMNQVGRILLSAIPVIYDTARVIQIVDEEGEPSMIGINNAPMQEGQKQPYDLTQGKYHVRVTTGSSYTTKRQEAANFYSQLFQQAPDLMKIGADLLFKNLDMPGSEALAARFEKTIPPQLLGDNQQQQIPPQIAQQLQQMQQLIQAGAQQIQQLEAQLKDKQADQQIKASEVAVKSKEADIKAGELQIKALQAQHEMQQQPNAVLQALATLAAKLDGIMPPSPSSQSH